MSKSNVNAKDINGMTELHKAASNNNASQILYLLSEGADVNAKDNLGCTPLHTAAIYG